MLELIDVSYRNLLHNITLNVGKGETVGLIGRSGSGKTLTSQAILGFISIDSGKILFENRDIETYEQEQFLGSSIGFVFQDPLTALNPTMRISKQVAEALRSTDRAKIASLLESVGIAKERMDDYPFQFSGGMRQRVGIAMAIARHPKLLIADEPTTALDYETQKEILALLKHLIAERNMALLLISHDLSVIKELCTRAYFLDAGRIIEEGLVAKILENPQTEAAKKIVFARKELAGALL